MNERRVEPRFLCSELIKVRLEDAGRAELTAILEDISPSGACLQTEEPLALGARVCLMCRRRRLRGTVKYCVRNEIGYFSGVQFDAGHKWSRQLFEPRHMLEQPGQVLVIHGVLVAPQRDNPYAHEFT